MKIQLGTIAEEAAACRERWNGYDPGTLAMHVHHNVPFEILTQSAEKRIAYILNVKPEDERALRLRCFAPVDLARFPKLRKANAEWLRARAALQGDYAECKQIAAAWAWRKAKFAWEQANAALEEICAAIPHAELCPLGSDCPWDGETIFRIGRKEK
jgi:hypothetical protein